ncbi:hypothetical protein QLX08_009757 [Tetragonisca angustula]|uniref:Aminopeptidase n=1 Tax=Tetragonisca angustula TaxID=166442 RepID=A0AAW0ZFL8_9HYME
MTGILIPLLVSLTFASLARGDAASPQANDSNYRLPLEAKPTHYNLILRVDMTNYRFFGIAQYTIKAISDSQTITLNSKNLTINSVRITNSIGQANLTNEFELNDEYETLTIKLLREKIVENQEYILTIEYNGVLNDQLRGFYKSISTKKNGRQLYAAATHFEPTGARLAFPCWDEPAIKATFEITIINSEASQYRAISNMNEIEVSVSPVSTSDNWTSTTDNLRFTKFQVTPPMSTYLVAFVVSDYEYKEDNSTEMQFRVWTKPESIDQTQYALKIGRQLLEEMERYTDIKFSHYIPKMDQVSLVNFSAGAMENWGLVTYRESALLAEQNDSVVRRMRVSTIIAHEFAHQWFGNLVSPEWWTYIWLNEGFADYFEYFLTHKIIPEWRLDELFVVNNIQGVAFTADVVENQRPMNHKVNTPQEISSLFDNIAYQKSGSVIRMMSHILGEENFQNGLRRYLNSNRAKAANSDILLEELGNGKTYNGVSFKKIMDNWVNKPGYPVVTVRKVNNTFELRQKQFTLHEPTIYETDNSETNGTKWWVPVTYVTSKNMSFNNTYPSQWLAPNEEKLVIPVSDEEEWILVNVKQTGYYRVNYESAIWESLVELLNSKNYINVHPTNRAQLIDDAFNMARINSLSYEIALKLMAYLNRETDHIVWQTSFRHLQFLHNLMRTSGHYNMFQVYVQNILTAVTNQVNYRPKHTDTDLEKLLRINAIDWACRANVTKCTEYVNSEFNKWLNNSTRKFYDDLKTNVICSGLRLANDNVWNQTLSIVLEIKDNEERLDLYALLACSQSEKILEHYLTLCLQENAVLSFSSAVSHVISRHPRGANIALRVLVANLARIKSGKNGSQVIVSVANSIASAVTTVGQLRQLNEILKKLEGVKIESVLNVLTKALANLNWIDLHANTVNDWIHNFNSASSFTFASLLLALSILVTRLY